MLDELLEDVQYAIEETNLMIALLEVLELLLVNRQPGPLNQRITARHAHAVLTQAISVSETAVDFIKRYPERLEDK